MNKPTQKSKVWQGRRDVKIPGGVAYKTGMEYYGRPSPDKLYRPYRKFRTRITDKDGNITYEPVRMYGDSTYTGSRFITNAIKVRNAQGLIEWWTPAIGCASIDKPKCEGGYKIYEGGCPPIFKLPNWTPREGSISCEQKAVLPAVPPLKFKHPVTNIEHTWDVPRYVTGLIGVDKLLWMEDDIEYMVNMYASACNGAINISIFAKITVIDPKDPCGKVYIPAMVGFSSAYTGHVVSVLSKNHTPLATSGITPRVVGGHMDTNESVETLYFDHHYSGNTHLGNFCAGVPVNIKLNGLMLKYGNLCPDIINGPLGEPLYNFWKCIPPRVACEDYYFNWRKEYIKCISTAKSLNDQECCLVPKRWDYNSYACNYEYTILKEQPTSLGLIDLQHKDFLKEYFYHAFGGETFVCKDDSGNIFEFDSEIWVTWTVVLEVDRMYDNITEDGCWLVPATNRQYIKVYYAINVFTNPHLISINSNPGESFDSIGPWKLGTIQFQSRKFDSGDVMPPPDSVHFSPVCGGGQAQVIHEFGYIWPEVPHL